MPTRFLVIGPEEKDKIANLIKLASQNVIDVTSQNVIDVMKIARADPASIIRTLMESLTIDIPFGFEVTYSHEKHPEMIVRHISISVDTPGRTPTSYAVDVILEAFGMDVLGENTSQWWLETITPTFRAVNVLQKL